MNKKRLITRIAAAVLTAAAVITGICLASVPTGAAPADSVNVIQKALRMPIGGTQKLDVTASGTYTFASSDSKVAAVSDKGVITAKAVGHADITVTSGNASETITVDVYDPATETETEPEFRVSVFWGPTWSLTTPEQYDLLADAYVNWVMMPGDGKLNGYEGIYKASALCYERGMHLIGIDYGTVSGRANTQPNEWDSFYEAYKYCAGLGGIFLSDEPMNANPFADDYANCQRVWPGFYTHLNFLPSHVYASSAVYRRQMDDFINLIGSEQFQYLTFDRYPFGMPANSFDTGFYANLEDMRLVGLRNNVKTATYIQSISNGGMRRTNPTEIQFEVNICLAYGVKMYRYFTWLQPTGQGETFSPAIVDASGKPTDLYEPVKEINRRTMNWGPTLMKVDALEVFHGSGTDGKNVPSDFFAIPTKGKNVLISFMRDMKTGRNYFMVVNKSFTRSQSVTLQMDAKLKDIDEISADDGNAYLVILDNHTMQLELEAGEARLFALPEGFDWYKAPAAPAKGENLAADRQVSGTYSDGDSGAGLYLWNLTDGVTAKKPGNSGWRAVGSADDQNASVTVNLGAVRTVSRVDLFPAGADDTYGIDFPTDFDIEISKDGEMWETVVMEQGFETALPSFTFKPKQAQYIRLNITGMRRVDRQYQAGLAEIMVFEDDGRTSEIVPFNKALTDALNEIENTDVSMASKANRQALADAVAAARQTVADPKATIEDIRNAVVALQDAFHNLLTPSQLSLKAVIDYIGTLSDEQRDEMEIDRLAALQVYMNPESTDEQLEAAMARIRNSLLATCPANKLTDNIAAKRYDPEIIYSSNLWDSYEALGWSWKFINDETSNLWSSELTIMNAQQQAWIGYKFKQPEVIDTVIITPRGDGIDFPKHWVLQISQDGENWIDLLEDKRANNHGEELVLEFEPVLARYIRFFGKKLQNGGDGYAMQLTEMAVYHKRNTEAATSLDALTAAIETAEKVSTAGFSDESVSRLTKAISRAKALLTAETASQAQVNKALTDMAWASENLTEPEPETEPPTEAPTEPNTEPETEPQSATADTLPETAPETQTGNATEADTEADKPGCASALAGTGAAVAMAAAAGVAVLRKKKERD